MATGDGSATASLPLGSGGLRISRTHRLRCLNMKRPGTKGPKQGVRGGVRSSGHPKHGPYIIPFVFLAHAWALLAKSKWKHDET